MTLLTVVPGLAALVRPLEVGGRVPAYALSATAGPDAALALAGGQLGRA